MGVITAEVTEIEVPESVRQEVLEFGLEFFDKPRRSNSNSSDAIYLAGKRYGAISLLFQYLSPYSKTSRHYHIKTTEVFHNLWGRCFVEVEGESDKPIELAKRSIIIPSVTIHQVRTRDEGALTLLEMWGHCKGLGMNDHYYL
jgi:hypothetical protein